MEEKGMFVDGLQPLFTGAPWQEGTQLLKA